MFIKKSLLNNENNNNNLFIKHTFSKSKSNSSIKNSLFFSSLCVFVDDLNDFFVNFNY